MSTTSSPSPSQFVQIIVDDAPFPWQYTSPETGEKMATVFSLRVIPDKRNKQIRREHTKTKWKNGQKVEDIDWDAVASAQIDEAVVAWDTLKGRKSDGTVVDLPCTLEFKRRLPERLKGEIIRICIGKETSHIGQDDGDGDDDDREGHSARTE